VTVNSVPLTEGRIFSMFGRRRPLLLVDKCCVLHVRCTDTSARMQCVHVNSRRCHALPQMELSDPDDNTPPTAADDQVRVAVT
jgi:hypothetical protein